MLLNLLDEDGVLWKNEVDGSSFSTETTCSTNSVDVVFLFERKLVVNNETNLLHIDTSSKEVSSDENTN